MRPFPQTTKRIRVGEAPSIPPDKQRIDLALVQIPGLGSMTSTILPFAVGRLGRTSTLVSIRIPIPYQQFTAALYGETVSTSVFLSGAAKILEVSPRLTSTSSATTFSTINGMTLDDRPCRTHPTSRLMVPGLAYQKLAKDTTMAAGLAMPRCEDGRKTEP